MLLFKKPFSLLKFFKPNQISNSTLLDPICYWKENKIYTQEVLLIHCLIKDLTSKEYQNHQA